MNKFFKGFRLCKLSYLEWSSLMTSEYNHEFDMAYYVFYTYLGSD